MEGNLYLAPVCNTVSETILFAGERQGLSPRSFISQLVRIALGRLFSCMLDPVGTSSQLCLVMRVGILKAVDRGFPLHLRFAQLSPRRFFLVERRRPSPQPRH